MMKTAIAVAFSATAVAAFMPSAQHHHKILLPLASTILDENDSSHEESQQPAVPQQEQSASFSLEGSDLAGNWGFDPLGLARSKENLWMYREAEMKHARLAMLVRIIHRRASQQEDALSRTSFFSGCIELACI